MSFTHFTQCNLNIEVYGFYSQEKINVFFFFFLSLFCRSMSLYVPGLLHCSTIHINCLCLFCVSTCFCVYALCVVASVKLWSCLLFMLSTLSSNTPHTKRGVAVNKHACMWECVRMHVRLLCVYVCIIVYLCVCFAMHVL